MAPILSPSYLYLTIAQVASPTCSYCVPNFHEWISTGKCCNNYSAQRQSRRLVIYSSICLRCNLYLTISGDPSIFDKIPQYSPLRKVITVVNVLKRSYQLALQSRKQCLCQYLLPIKELPNTPM